MPGRLAGVADASVGTLVAELVIHLPADDAPVLPVALGAGPHDPPRGFAIGDAVETAHAPGAEVAPHPVPRHLEDLAFVEEPDRESRRGRSEDDVDAPTGQDPDGPVEEREIVMALLGLQHGPREFHHAHDVHAESLHSVRV